MYAGIDSNAKDPGLIAAVTSERAKPFEEIWFGIDILWRPLTSAKKRDLATRMSHICSFVFSKE